MALLPLVALFLFDFKETGPLRHAGFTGQANEIVLRNLRALHAAGASIQLQCPVVPGFNDRKDHFAGIATLARSLSNLECGGCLTTRWERTNSIDSGCGRR